MPAKETERENERFDSKRDLDEVPLTHPQKRLYEDCGVTKLDLANYYVSISKWILPHIEDRLAVLFRCPQGNEKACFFQKHPGPGTPAFLHQFSVQEKKATANYLVVDDVRGLVWLAQIGALELHVWGSRIDDIERPDRVIFDLDPAPDIDWPTVVQSAFEIREVLETLGLVSFVKTTGGKGLHVIVPIRRQATWPEAKEFSANVAAFLATQKPDRFTTNISKAARRGKILIDFLRNQRGATSVAPYSPRARSGATVSVPIRWDELCEDLHPDHFTVFNVPDRLAKLAQDPFEGISKIRQTLNAASKRLGSVGHRVGAR